MLHYAVSVLGLIWSEWLSMDHIAFLVTGIFTVVQFPLSPEITKQGKSTLDTVNVRGSYSYCKEAGKEMSTGQGSGMKRSIRENKVVKGKAKEGDGEGGRREKGGDWGGRETERQR